MFRETVIDKRGDTAVGTASELHAFTLLRTAVQRGYRTEATRTGGVIITRDVWDGFVLPKKAVITLEPEQPVTLISKAVRLDLEDIAADSSPYRVTTAGHHFRRRAGRLYARLTSIPPMTAQRLIDRGLVVVGPEETATSNGYMPEVRTPVRLSLAARLALVAQAHRTSTRAPRGYVYPADIGMTGTVGLNKPGRRAGQVYDGTSSATCICRGLSRPAGDRNEAQRYAREHREEVTGAMLAALFRVAVPARTA